MLANCQPVKQWLKLSRIWLMTKYGPFIKGLAYAQTTQFKSEASQRQTILNAFDNVVLQGKSVKEALSIAATEEQKILDKE